MAIGTQDHEHSGVEEIAWSRLGRLLIELAETIRRDWQPEVVVGIAKGGVIPAVFLSSAFQVDFFPIKLSSRHNEIVVYDEPKWFIYPTDHLRGRKVLLVDHMIASGRTLRMAREEIEKAGAKECRTVALAAHGLSARPDYVGLVTDALIVWPWERDCLSEDGTWAIAPEYLEEMRRVPDYRPGPSPAREPENPRRA